MAYAQELVRAVTITDTRSSGLAMGRDVSCRVGAFSLRVIAGHREPLRARAGQCPQPAEVAIPALGRPSGFDPEPVITQ
jgi:hypothetical protein